MKIIQIVLVSIVLLVSSAVFAQKPTTDTAPRTYETVQAAQLKLSRRVLNYRKTHTQEETNEFAERLSTRLGFHFLRPDSPAGKAMIERGEQRVKDSIKPTVKPASVAPVQDMSNCEYISTYWTYGICVYSGSTYYCGMGYYFCVTSVMCPDSGFYLQQTDQGMC